MVQLSIVILCSTLALSPSTHVGQRHSVIESADMGADHAELSDRDATEVSNGVREGANSSGG